MIGISTCSSSPVDIRGFQFVDPSGLMCPLKVIGVPPKHPVPPVKSIPVQPKLVEFKMPSCSGAICNWLGSRMALIPKSVNGAKTTGPAIGMRYSRFVKTWVSPPGKTI